MEVIDYQKQCYEMVEHQIKNRGITNSKLLQIMQELPRHYFIAEQSEEQAYEDHAIPIDCNQTISQPFVVAAMTEALDIEPHHKVLEVGTGSGYQTAILKGLSDSVYTIERIASLSQKAQNTLRRLGIDRVHFRIGDGSKGWKEAAPFDRIMVTAACQMPPFVLLGQLNDLGKLIAPIGSNIQKLKLFIKDGEEFKIIDLFDVVFVPLICDR